MSSRKNKREVFADAKKTRALPATPDRKAYFSAPEWLGWVALAGLTLYFLGASWRKWPDPLIDFGRELYLAWRLANGAVLYKDAEDVYGPLSQYLNAGVFALFGPGMMILVMANLVVFTGIVILIYKLFRRAWGVGPALVSSSIFISVFAFGQYVGTGNNNYATPYSHEATHGLLVCLMLVAALFRWVEDPTLIRSSLAGGLFGLAAILKPEIMLAAGVITVAALAMRWRFRHPVPATAVLTWAGCSVLPTLAFTAYFRAYVPWSEALRLACSAWMNVGSGYRGDAIQTAFMGLDHPWSNLAAHVVATLAAILLIAVIAGIARMTERNTGFWTRVLPAVLLVAGVTWVGCFVIHWRYVGRCFLGLTMIYVILCVIWMLRDVKSGVLDQRSALRLLIALLAASLMVRMLLSGRLYHYGFYQAALAGVLIPGVILGELPGRLDLRRFGKTVAVVTSLLLMLIGVVTLSTQSQGILNSKTYSVGEGMDQFYAFRPDLDPKGEIIQALITRLGQSPLPKKLLVLPEGPMINYLARMPSPVAAVYFHSAAISNGREEAIVDQLKQQRPDWVVIVSHNLRGFGIQRYGEAPGKGQRILDWVTGNYEREMSVGGDPLDAGQSGGILLRRRSVPIPASRARIVVKTDRARTMRRHECRRGTQSACATCGAHATGFSWVSRQPPRTLSSAVWRTSLALTRRFCDKRTTASRKAVPRDKPSPGCNDGPRHRRAAEREVWNRSSPLFEEPAIRARYDPTPEGPGT